ncbi:MAG: metallophosphoesterase [Polyangiaceae bacterium]
MLTLGLISDLHFGVETFHKGKLRKLTRDAPKLAKAFVDRMNEVVRPDLVVNLGDDIEDESRDADLARYRGCFQVLSRAKADLVHVAGNHDTVHLSHADLRATWGKGPWDAEVSARDLCYAFDRGGFRFVVMHTHEAQDVDITVGEAQLRWLAAELHEARLPVIVLMHHSASEQDLRGNYWFEGREHVALVKERAEMRRLLLASGKARLVLNGHVHWNHFDVIDGLPFVTVQSLIENLDEDAPGRAAAAHAVVRLDERRTIIEIEGAERARYQVDVTR